MFESHLKPHISFPSVSGSVCSFDSQYAGLPLKSCVVDVDYTGRAISGVNVHNPSVFVGCYPLNPSTDTINGITYTIYPDGKITLSGTSTDSIALDWYIYEIIAPNANGRWIYLNNTFVSASVTIQFYQGGTWLDTWGLNAYKRNSTYTSLAGKTINHLRLTIPSGITISGSIQPFFEVDNNDNTHSITFTTPIYGGTYDCLTGIVTSDKDSGGGDISPTYQQTATANCETNLGQNNIWADTGDTTLQYIKLG